MTRAQVAQLWAVQQVDLEIERAEAEREALRQALATDAAQTARVALAQATRRAQASAQRLREAEAALEEMRRRLQRQEARLYAGGVPAKDLGKLQQEIEHMQATRATQEDTVVTAMVSAEEAQAAVEGRRQALRETEGARTEERAR
ncbi:MAG: hypothetical protein IVW57_19820, partial [Ktedonobacterales bacterium]|nr:hypothetical protein [Ktedonobacterales bacterium]